MKKLHLFLSGFIALLLLAGTIEAQPVNKSSNPATVNKAEKTYTYESLSGDPLKARIYTLDNGLKVYMTVYKDAPRIQTYIAVKAGSKNDPADATGLAHYLEHMLFKGTDKYGSLDFSKEEPLINKIEDLYEVYRKTTDENKRKEIYQQIDSISGVASGYAIAQEYDKMISAIGAKGTNAYTSVEQTVYVNDIPANQVEKWVAIEAERYRKPVLRLFHTELEAVYEEKNRGLDNDGRKLWEMMFAELFKKHSYGTQTTIGTIEHLKNPSLKEIHKYFNTYYVPNNMAICLSGDFDPDAVIKMIDAKFGSMPRKEVPKFIPPVESPINEPVVKEVIGPDAETVAFGFRFAGVGTKEADMVTLIDKILYNSKAGLIDLNLNQSQKVLDASSFNYGMKDYSIHIFSGDAKQGQSLEEVKNLLLSQIELVKKGEFPDWLLPAIINDLKVQQIKNLENNNSRANEFVSSFVLDIPWKEQISEIERLSKITKQEIIDFAKKNYHGNYVVVYKRTGEDKNIQKVIKPQITPVKVNRESESSFVKEIHKSTVEDIEPAFLNYKEDIKSLALKNSIPVSYLKNEENETFNLYYILEMGTNHNKKIDLAIQYLPYLGTSKYSPAQIQEEFYKIGCSFSVFNSEDQVYVSLKGLNEHFDKSVELFEHLLANAQPNEEALSNLVADVLKKRADAKLSKQSILWNAMYNYGIYGAKSPFTNILSETELKALKPTELIPLIKEITSYEHKILYYGPAVKETLTASLNTLHKTPVVLKPVPAEAQFTQLENTGNLIYVVDYDMKQAEIIMLSKSTPYNKENAPAISLFNEYFGSGMSSVVFQEMRESKALAYSVFASYQTPQKKEKSHYLMAYIGAQADKLPEAMAGMFELFNNMPKSESKLETGKNAALQKIRTERITKSNILFNYERAKKLGLDYDIRKDVYNTVPSLKIGDIESFQQKHLKSKNFTILVLGNQKNLDLKTLEKYGTVKFLKLEEVFGY